MTPGQSGKIRDFPGQNGTLDRWSSGSERPDIETRGAGTPRDKTASGHEAGSTGCVCCFGELPQQSGREHGQRKATNVKPRKRAAKSRHIQVFLLDKVTERTPKTGEEMVLLQAGMGRRTIDIPEDADHAETGGSGLRKLNVVSPEAEDYSGAHLSTGYTGKSCYYIMPIQESLDTSPLPFTAQEFSRMPKAKCINCQVQVPVQLLSLHLQDCQQIVRICPVCEVPYPIKDLPLHASFCGEGLFSSHLSDPGREPSTSSAVQRVLPNPSPLAPGKNAWISVQDPQEALQLFLEQLKQEAGSQPSLVLSLDATDSDEQRDGSLIRFYKENREKSQWTAPFHCIIKGDAALGEGVMRHVLSLAIARLKHGFNLNFGNAAETLFFEGEPEHLVPAASPSIGE
ncbi:hypothetical protein MHYP_G00362730 [Metynnis hypsauchen]